MNVPALLLGDGKMGDPPSNTVPLYPIPPHPVEGSLTSRRKMDLIQLAYSNLYMNRIVE